MSSALALERQGPLGLVTLNRADRHNAFDDAIIAELTEALRSMEAEESIRIVVLAAAGRSFSAGADLEWMKRMSGYSMDDNRRDAMGLAALMRTLAHLRKPTVARVQGPAYGGGVGLVACCDIAVASTNATFAFSEAKLGLIPAVISPYVVAAIGERAARRYFLTAERFDAAEAWRLGLRLRDRPASEQTEAKALLRSVGGRPITSELIQDTAERIAKIRSSPEGREGISAFLEKRRAAWIPPEPEPTIPPEPPPGI